MGDYSEVGGFVVRCPRCKGVLYKYIIGDQGSKDKYIGPPSPKRIFARYDVKDSCPFCGARFSGLPRIKVLSVEQFKYSYSLVVSGGRELLVERVPSINSVTGLTATANADGEADVPGL